MDTNQNGAANAGRDLSWAPGAVVAVLAFIAVVVSAITSSFERRHSFQPSALGRLGSVYAQPPPIHHVRLTVDQLVAERGDMPRHYPIADVDWRAHQGIWIVLVLADLPDNAFHHIDSDAAWRIGHWLASIRQGIRESGSGAEVWLVRSDIPTGFEGRLLGMPEFANGCFMYSAGCFDRFLIAFADPGADGTHWQPQVDWILRVHRARRVDHNARSEVALPLMVLIRPDGELVAVNRDEVTSLQLPGRDEFLQFFAEQVRQFDGGKHVAGK